LSTAAFAGCLLSVASASAKVQVFRVNDFGARGDGTTINTTAIQATLDAAAKAKHAVVTFAPGTYLSRAIFIKSGTSLSLDQNVTLRAVRTLDAFPMMPTRVAGIEMTWPAALVNIYGRHDAAITGSGTIDGDGKPWWDGYWALRRDYDSRGLRWAADYDDRRPRLIQIFRSQHVKLQGPTLIRSPFWTVHICYSEDVQVDTITIRNNIGGRGPSTDGIDIDSRTARESSR
jgi:polygalacturonase